MAQHHCLPQQEAHLQQVCPKSMPSYVLLTTGAFLCEAANTLVGTV